MHVRYCTCPPCVWRLANTDDEERTSALVAIACTGARSSRVEHVSDGIVRRASRRN